MKIQYLGHSSFKLTSSAGTSLVTDPFAPQVGYDMACVRADGITVSHHHFDHDYVGGVDGNPAVFDRAGKYSLGDITIEGIPAFHDDVSGRKRGTNIIFKFVIDGVRICHLGDLGEPFSKERVQSVTPADVLLIPVGGNYTIDAKTAKKYAENINPAVVIPMHYRQKDCKIDIDGVKSFCDLFGQRAYFTDGDEAEFSVNGTELICTGKNFNVITTTAGANPHSAHRGNAAAQVMVLSRTETGKV